MVEQEIKKPESTSSADNLVRKTLEIENLDYRIFVPSLVNLVSESVIQDLLNKFKFVSEKVLDFQNVKNKPYFFLYEELFYILNKVASRVKFDFG